MTEINTNIISYLLAKRVYKGELSQTGAARQINEEYGVNVNSAKIMFAVYKSLVNGVEFKRALSAPDMNYFLAQVLAENGAQSLRDPVKALRKHIEYYEDKNGCNLNALRKLATQYETLYKNAVGIIDIENNLQIAVEKSTKDGHDIRRQRLESAQRKPKEYAVYVKAYSRNPDVIAEVLYQAGGICDRCNREAPFKKRKDNAPYLEVHHKNRLADGGEDAVNNAEALCPNCHRELHFGQAES